MIAKDYECKAGDARKALERCEPERWRKHWVGILYTAILGVADDAHLDPLIARNIRKELGNLTPAEWLGTDPARISHLSEPRLRPLDALPDEDEDLPC